jgi:hypothetical protein
MAVARYGSAGTNSAGSVVKMPVSGARSPNRFPRYPRGCDSPSGCGPRAGRAWPTADAPWYRPSGLGASWPVVMRATRTYAERHLPAALHGDRGYRDRRDEAGQAGMEAEPGHPEVGTGRGCLAHRLRRRNRRTPTSTVTLRDHETSPPRGGPRLNSTTQFRSRRHPRAWENLGVMKARWGASEEDRPCSGQRDKRAGKADRRRPVV